MTKYSHRRVDRGDYDDYEVLADGDIIGYAMDAATAERIIALEERDDQLAAALARAEAAEALLARFVDGLLDECRPMFPDKLLTDDEVALLDEAKAFLASARANKEQGDD